MDAQIIERVGKELETLVGQSSSGEVGAEVHVRNLDRPDFESFPGRELPGYEGPGPAKLWTPSTGINVFAHAKQ